jgi:hypothetical protein
MTHLEEMKQSQKPPDQIFEAAGSGRGKQRPVFETAS